MSTSLFFFFFNDTATTEIYTLSLHDALPISTCATDSRCRRRRPARSRRAMYCGSRPRAVEPGETQRGSGHELRVGSGVGAGGRRGVGTVRRRRGDPRRAGAGAAGQAATAHGERDVAGGAAVAGGVPGVLAVLQTRSGQSTVRGHRRGGTVLRRAVGGEAGRIGP